MTRGIPTKAPGSTSSGSRLIWVLIGLMLLLVVLALVGMARAPREPARPRSAANHRSVREFTFTESGS
jgi:hypothetical protein